MLKYLKWCPACKKRKDVKRVCEYGIYGSKSWYPYHDDCLENVLCYPERYGHKVVDYFIGITEKIKSQQRRDTEEQEYILKRQVRARSICVDEILGERS